MTTQNDIEVKIVDFTGSFAENKDVAREIREKYIFPMLKKGQKIVLNYEGVSNTTQSFTHALISHAIRLYGDKALQEIIFKSCNETIKEVISFVVQYMQQSPGDTLPDID